MDNPQGPVVRPGAGQTVNVVMLGEADPLIVGGRVLFDRGRGLVVEAAGPVRVRWAKGGRALLVFAIGERVFHLRCSVGEVLSPERAYLLPSGNATEMEKREYIRAMLTVQAALVVGEARPEPPPPLRAERVELSASGFRWFGPTEARPGARVWLCLAEEGGRVGLFPAEVVRVELRDRVTGELAGRFVGIEPDDRDAVLRMVFQARYEELGLVAEE